MKTEDVDKLVAMLDQKVAKGVGHINITSDTTQKELFREEKSNECNANTPCKIPNLNEIDKKQEEIQ